MQMTAVEIISILATIILLTTFVTVASNRMHSLVRSFVIQSISLGALAFTVAVYTGMSSLYIVAAITFVLKGALIPYVLLYTMKKIKIDREVEPLVSIPISLLICGALTIAAFYITEPIISGVGIETITSNCLAISLAVVLIGMFTMISRKKAITQIMGLLTMENGLFLAAISVTFGMPMIVELGIFFDILITVLILGVFVFRISKTFETVDTSFLKRLRD